MKATDLASAFFSLLSLLQTWRFMIRCEAAASARPVWLWRAYHVVWCFTYLAAAVFHLADSAVSERADYFSIALALVYHTSLGLVYAAQMQCAVRSLAVALLLIPGSMAYLHYLNAMLHRFDYGFHSAFCAGVAVVGTVLWAVAAYRRQEEPHAKYIMYALLCSAASVPLELYDFSPLAGLFDGHSLWHASALAMAYFWHRFIVADLSAAPAGQRRTFDDEDEKTGGTLAPLIVLLGAIAYLQLVAFVMIKLA